MPLLPLLQRFFGQRRSARDIEEELAAHLDMAAEELHAQGMSAEQAARQARIRLGGFTQSREAYRAQARPPLVDSIAADFAYAARQLRRNPGFALVAILTLALGIGATTAIFSLVEAVLLHSLPYGHASQLVYLYTPNSHLPVPPQAMPPSNADFRDIQRANHSFSSMTEFQQATYNLSTAGAAAREYAVKVDANFFATLQTAPRIGRAITAQDTEPGHDHIAVISDSLWHTQFAGARDILARSIMLDGSRYRIIGVLPPDFQYPTGSDLPFDDAVTRRTNVWLPLVLTPQQAANRDWPDNWAIARLKPGVSPAQAQTEMALLMQRLDPLHNGDPLGSGKPLRGWTALVQSLRDTALGPVRHLLWLLLAAVACVLLIACGNAANLLLARAAARSHELGVRATLGAGRGRLIRQLFTESLLLSDLAGALGLVLAWLFLRLLLRLDPGDIPRMQQAALNLPVLAFTAALVLLTCVLFGMLPAFSASRVHLLGLLKAGGARGIVSGGDRGRRLLMAGEIALVTLLLACTGLLIRSYVKLTAVQPGFSASTLTFSVNLNAQVRDMGAFYGRLLEQITHVPGVQAVGATTVLPFTNAHSITSIWIDGYVANRPDMLVEGAAITPGYFRAMATPLIAGRFLTNDDRLAHPTPVLVNQSFARTYFPGQDALGKRLRNSPDPKQPWRTIVGVVSDVRNNSLEQQPVPQLYTPFDDLRNASIAVRSSLPPASLIATLRLVMRSLDPSIALANIQTMQQAVAASTARRRFQMSLLTAFAVIALLLAAIGLYGLLAWTVRQRVPEIGLRMALGASRGRVLRMVVTQGMRLVLAGLAVGSALALPTAHLLASLLFGIPAYDPWTFLLAPMLLAAAALLACTVPAWHAARIEPMDALRAE